MSGTGVEQKPPKSKLPLPRRQLALKKKGSGRNRKSKC